jgi:acyl-coenzyme A thioesterase PaaI-like protein
VIGTVGWLSRPESRTATVNLSMTFLRPTVGDRVVAQAWLLRAGMNLVFAAAEIRGGSGDVTARCDGTCAVAQGKVDGNEIYERMRTGRIAP